MIRSLFFRDKIFQIVLVVIILFFTPFESYNLKNARILKSEGLKKESDDIYFFGKKTWVDRY